MASEVDWNSVGGQGGGGGGSGGKDKVNFVKFTAGSSKTLRPIGKAVMFYKFFMPSTRRSVVVDPEFKNDAAAKLSAHSGEEVRPTLRYAINVIDREDNKIKVLEGGQQIFEHFANWSKGNNGAPPGGSNGMDWTISASGEEKNRKYTATPIRSAPLTESEISRIKEAKEIFSLKEVFKGCPLENVIERVTGEKSSGPSKSGPAKTASAGPGDDPAGW